MTRINSKIIVPLGEESAKDVIRKVKEQQLKKEKEEAARKANEEQEKLWKENPEALAEGEEVVPLEGLTEEELLEQVVGKPMQEETEIEEVEIEEEALDAENPLAEFFRRLAVPTREERETSDSGSVDNTNKSLAALQQRDTPNDINGILNDRRYADSVYDILEEKGFEGDTVEEVIQFLQNKNMPIANINNIDAWVDMLKNCRTS